MGGLRALVGEAPRYIQWTGSWGTAGGCAPSMRALENGVACDPSKVKTQPSIGCVSERRSRHARQTAGHDVACAALRQGIRAQGPAETVPSFRNAPNLVRFRNMTIGPGFPPGPSNVIISPE